MRKTVGALAAFGLLVVGGCGSATPAAQTVTSTVPTTVVTTALKTVVSTAVKTSKVTETETATETVTPAPTTTAQRISEAAACRLFLFGPGGQDGAAQQLSDVILNDLSKPSIGADDAAKIAEKTKSIKENLESLKARAPEDWAPYLQAHIDVADQILKATTEGGSLNISTDDLRAAGYELTSRCGA